MRRWLSAAAERVGKRKSKTGKNTHAMDYLAGAVANILKYSVGKQLSRSTNRGSCLPVAQAIFDLAFPTAGAASIDGAIRREVTARKRQTDLAR
jgi:hypothetical protein